MRSLGIMIAFIAAFAGPVAAGWNAQTSGTWVDLHDITANHSSINKAWACGDAGTIVATTNGMAWTAQTSGTTANLYGIAFQELAGGPVIVVGEGGIILRTVDAGTTWTPIASGTTATLRHVTDFGFVIVGDGGTTATLYGTPMFAARDFVVGDQGLVLHGTNNGSLWSSQSTGTRATLRELELSTNNTSRIYCVGDGGMVLKTTDAGLTWGRQESGTFANLHAVFFYLNDQNGWAVGEAGTILRTSDSGGPILPTDVDGLTDPVASPFRVYVRANPFHDRTALVLENTRGGSLQVDVFDAAGRSVQTWSGRALAGIAEIPIELGRHVSGIYIYRLRTDTLQRSGKLILAK